MSTVRTTRELAALGIPDGEGSVVRLRRDDRAHESFEITVGEDIAVFAGTAAGAFRATRQLLHNLRAQGLVPHGRVSSAPVVTERGFHLDAARKHFPAPWIVDLLHALADVGITTFQWHVSENEGFRIGSEAFPEIVSSAHVTRAEALVVADTAADLHIDIVPSLDMPGHLRHALAAHPELRLPDAGGLPTDHALDITRTAAVDFAAALIDDVAALFPRSTRWHLGGDEFVDFARIEEYPALAAAAREKHGPRATGFDLLTAFVNAMSAHLRARGLAPRVWNDGMLRSETVALDPDLVLTWWTNWHVEMRPLAADERAHLGVRVASGSVPCAPGRHPAGDPDALPRSAPRGLVLRLVRRCFGADPRRGRRRGPQAAAGDGRARVERHQRTLARSVLRDRRGDRCRDRPGAVRPVASSRLHRSESSPFRTPSPTHRRARRPTHA